MSNITFRFAEEGDAGVVLDFIRGLAEYEHAPERVVATELILREELFVKESAEVLFVEEDGNVEGFALFFHSFSTWLGRAGLYLEDLFVRPQSRGRGLGKALLTELARIAVQRGYGRMEWACLDWNTPSIDFYLAMGAQPLNEWTTYRLEGDSLLALAKRD